MSHGYTADFSTKYTLHKKTERKKRFDKTNVDVFPYSWRIHISAMCLRGPVLYPVELAWDRQFVLQEKHVGRDGFPVLSARVFRIERCVKVRRMYIYIYTHKHIHTCQMGKHFIVDSDTRNNDQTYCVLENN